MKTKQKKLYPYRTPSEMFLLFDKERWIQYKINYFFIKQISPCEKPVETRIFLN